MNKCANIFVATKLQIFITFVLIICKILNTKDNYYIFVDIYVEIRFILVLILALISTPSEK